MSAKSRKIIGIDPGSRLTGYGVVRQSPDGLLRAIDWGVIRIDPSLEFAERLYTIHEELSRILALHEPDLAVVEKVFLAKNASSALKLGQARGAAIVTCRIHRVPVSEFSAREIKASATGYGAASKEQVAGMVGKLLGIRETIPPDASDALAMAFCGATTNPLERFAGPS